jgi:CHAD domain-containing protein
MAVTVYDEVERKYDVAESALLPSLAGVGEVATVAQAVTADLEAVYYDTEDLALARHGVTLRRRTGGHDDGWHVKLPEKADTKKELRMPLGDASDTVPADLLGPVRSIVRDHPLVPVARVLNHRLTYRLLDAESRVLGEVCDDTVTGERLVGQPQSRHWREWEVELAEDSPLALDTVEAPLVAAGATPADVRSKLVRALGDGLPSAPQADAVGSDRRTAGGAFAAYLRQQLAELRTHDAGVRSDRPGSVHRLRIVARRLRSALTTYRPLFASGATDAVREELRWLGQALGEARDAQVLLERLDELVESEPPELVLGPVRQRLESTLGRSGREGRGRVLAALESERYFRLLDALDALVAEPPPLALGREPAASVLPGLLHRDFRRLRRAVKAAARAQEPQERDRALHEARKKAKRLRYAAESATAVLGAPARRLGKRAKRLQQALGRHQDTVLSRRTLRELGVQAHLSGENGFSFGRLHGLEDWHAARAQDSFEKAWKRLKRKGL